MKLDLWWTVFLAVAGGIVFPLILLRFKWVQQRLLSSLLSEAKLESVKEIHEIQTTQLEKDIDKLTRSVDRLTQSVDDRAEAEDVARAIEAAGRERDRIENQLGQRIDKQGEVFMRRTDSTDRSIAEVAKEGREARKALHEEINQLARAAVPRVELREMFGDLSEEMRGAIQAATSPLQDSIKGLTGRIDRVIENK